MARKSAYQVGEYSLGRFASRGVYCVTWREGRRRRRYVLDVGLDRPLSEGKAALELWVRRKEAAAAQDQRITIGAIMEKYIEDRRVEGKNVATMHFNWRRLKETFEHRQPADIATKIEVEGEQRTLAHRYAFDRHQQGAARDTIRTELARLRTAVRWAERQKLIEAVPQIWVPSKGESRDPALTDDDLIRWCAECREPHVRLTLIIAITTGARKEAIEELRWDAVDLVNRIIDFKAGPRASILDSSHRKGRAVVHISDLLLVALTEAQEWARSRFVIEYHGQRAGDVKKAVKRAAVRAGLPRYVGLHACRHMLATRALNGGVDMQKISRALGHRNVRTTEEIYAKARARMTEDVVNAAVLPITIIEHRSGSVNPKARKTAAAERAKRSLIPMVGATGIEPVTPTMSR